jgi:L-arabinose isomerase
MPIERPRIGLLPLYLALYDSALPTLLGEMAPFLNGVVGAFQSRGVDVIEAPVCRIKSDVAAAVEDFTLQEVDLIVTLHLAYSPSMESVWALVESRLPVLMLDTTPDPAFGLDTDPLQLLYNHGIHGVQDLASMLRRRGKDYWIVAGHLNDPTVMERACAIARGARAATRLRTSRALRIGPSFAGMGDFRVADLELFCRPHCLTMSSPSPTRRWRRRWPMIVRALPWMRPAKFTRARRDLGWGFASIWSAMPTRPFP